MALIIYKIITLIFGYGLIIGGFIIFGDSLDERIKILDIIISCIIFTQSAIIALFPMVDRNKSAHKEVGMMGIHYTFITIYSIAAITIMILGINKEWAFKTQLICQLALIFFLLIGRVLTLTSGNKVEEIHHKEKEIMTGKKQLADIMTLFVEDIACCKGLDNSIVDRINGLNNEIRYISPSNNPIATNLDQRFCNCVETITLLLKDTYLNSSQIEDEVAKLERIFIQRKKY